MHFCYHNAQFYMTCLHGETLGVRIIVAPAVYSKFKFPQTFYFVNSCIFTLITNKSSIDYSPLNLSVSSSFCIDWKVKLIYQEIIPSSMV